MSTLDDHRLLGETLAAAVGAGGRSRLDALSRISAHLRQQRLVVLLDGFERLLSAAPDLGTLVARCAALTIVVTSRLPLRVRVEREMRVAPLAVPEPGRTDPAHLMTVPAVRLLLHRARLVRPDAVVTTANAAAIAAICRAVDGLPLGLELAAARLRLLTAQELADRLACPLSVLHGGGRDTPARHRSLRAAIESSVEVLDADARTLFAWLAAFPAGVLLSDLEPVVRRCGRSPHWLLDPLAALEESSLASPARGRRWPAPQHFPVPAGRRHRGPQLASRAGT